MSYLKQVLNIAGYVVDQNNSTAIESVIEYLSVPQKKGMLFYGFHGTGKTWLMKLIAEHITPIEIVSTETILDSTRKNEFVRSYYLQQNYEYTVNLDSELNMTCKAKPKPFCFDELGGKNDRKLNIWGTEVYPMAEILKVHYEKKILCHAITNYELSDLEKIYGGETIDRFAEMFIIIQFKGGSRRK